MPPTSRFYGATGCGTHGAPFCPICSNSAPESPTSNNRPTLPPPTAFVDGAFLVTVGDRVDLWAGSPDSTIAEVTRIVSDHEIVVRRMDTTILRVDLNEVAAIRVLD